MAKKADLCECSGWRSIADCQKCPEYNTCGLCNRRVCQYVAVNVYHHNETEPDDLICRPCARAQGWNEREIATQAVNPETYEYGVACFEKAEV